MDKMSTIKRRLITSMVAMLLLIITIFGITYAYFTSKVIGNTSDRSADVQTGKLSLKYEDGNGLIELKKIKPGTTLDPKTFSVTNDGTLDIDTYDVILENIINELENYQDLKFTLTCKTDKPGGTCKGSTAIFPRTDGDTNSVLITNAIAKDETQTYELTVTYEETHTDQSDDMKKNVSARVNIKDDDEYSAKRS